MRTIHKYMIDAGYNEIVMPKNADILTAQIQDGFMMLWALVDCEAPTEDRIVCVVGTGHRMPDDMGRSEYISTVQSGPLVFHVFAHKAGSVLK